MRVIYLLFGVAACVALASNSVAAHDCDSRKGDTLFAKVQALNVLKTRTGIPTARDINSAITLAAILEPGADVQRWNQSMAATVTGYVAKIGVGGIESVNCHAKDPAHRDTHIDIVLSAGDAANEKKHVIVEVTPQLRVTHPDWTTANLRATLLGRCAKITGWMLFDVEHAPQSFNTAPSNPKDWRATAWEIHPITGIEIMQSCP